MAASNPVDLFVVANTEEFRSADQPDPLAFSGARILLLTGLVGAPWAFGAVDAWAWTILGLVAVLGLLLWAVGSVQRGTLNIVWSPLYVTMILFFGLGLAQYGARLSFDRWETRSALVLLVANLLFFFLSAQLFGNATSETRHAFGIVVLCFAGVLGLFSVLQFASGTQKIYWTFDTDSNFFGPYFNPDHFAGLMEMLIPVAAFYIAGQRKLSAAQALPIVVVTIAIASLLLSGSRSGLLSLSVEIVIAAALGLWLARTRQRKERSALIAIGASVIIVVIVAAALLFSWVDTGAVSKRLGAVATPGDAWSEWSSFRKSVVLDSFHMLRDHPVLGIGLGNFETAYPRYQSFPTDLTVDYAHNDFAEAIAETGVIGAALIFLALGIFLRASFRNLGERLREGLDVETSWIQAGAAVGCCGLLVHSFLDFNLHIPANAAWFSVLAAVAVTAISDPTKSLAIARPSTVVNIASGRPRRRRRAS